MKKENYALRILKKELNILGKIIEEWKDDKYIESKNTRIKYYLDLKEAIELLEKQ